MQRAAVLLSALAIVLGLAPSGVATAAQPPNCNGETLLSANYVTLDSNDNRVGSIQLCRDGDYYFAMYIHYGAVPSGRAATAYLTRYYNNSSDQWSCDVNPGQARNWCRTAGILATSSNVTFKAEGQYYAWTGDGYISIGVGETKICNKFACYN